MKTHFRNKLMAGLLTIVPIVLTIWVLYSLFHAVDGLLRPLLQPTLGKYYVTGMGVLVVLALVYFAGLLSSNFVGRRLVSLGDRVVERLPIARHVYAPAKQLLQTIVQSKEQALKRVVFIEYPVPGVHALGFVTGKTVNTDSGETFYHVFLPTSPNPTTGFVFLCRAEDLKETDLSVEEAVKLVMSAGVVSSGNVRIT